MLQDQLGYHNSLDQKHFHLIYLGTFKNTQTNSAIRTSRHSLGFGTLFQHIVIKLLGYQKKNWPITL